MKRLKNKYNEVFNDYALEKDGDKNVRSKKRRF